MASVKKITDKIKRLGKPDTIRGNPVYRWFCPSERYVVDFAEDYSAEGWKQYDTDQDAAYFGVWVNPKTLQTLSYAEGDWSLVECADVAAFNAEIESMNSFYGEGFIFKAYDMQGGCEVARQDRQEFLIS